MKQKEREEQMKKLLKQINDRAKKLWKLNYHFDCRYDSIVLVDSTMKRDTDEEIEASAVGTLDGYMH